MEHRIALPEPESIPQVYRAYFEGLEASDLLQALRAEQILLRELLRAVPEDQGDHRYAEGKWSIKEVVSHLIDAERVFGYRAHCIARGEKAALPAFEESDYVAAADAARRSLSSLLEELELARASTVALFLGLPDEHLDRVGTANQRSVSARVMGWSLAGHAAHHRRVLKERYL